MRGITRFLVIDSDMLADRPYPHVGAQRALGRTQARCHLHGQSRIATASGGRQSVDGQTVESLAGLQ